MEILPVTGWVPQAAGAGGNVRVVPGFLRSTGNHARVMLREMDSVVGGYAARPEGARRCANGGWGDTHTTRRRAMSCCSTCFNHSSSCSFCSGGLREANDETGAMNSRLRCCR